MLKPKWDIYHQSLRIFISLTYMHTRYYFWRNVRKYEMTPRGVVVTGARILTAATVAYQFRSAGKTGN